MRDEQPERWICRYGRSLILRRCAAPGRWRTVNGELWDNLLFWSVYWAAHQDIWTMIWSYSALALQISFDNWNPYLRTPHVIYTLYAHKYKTPDFSTFGVKAIIFFIISDTLHSRNAIYSHDEPVTRTTKQTSVIAEGVQVENAVVYPASLRTLGFHLDKCKRQKCDWWIPLLATHSVTAPSCVQSSITKSCLSNTNL